MNKSEIAERKMKKLSTKDLLAMYRCAFYSAMGHTNADPQPTDRQCMEWFNRVIAQAGHLTDPPITLIAHPPISVKTQSVIPEIVITRWDAKIDLPPWKDLPL